MKKAIAMLLVVLMIGSFAACSGTQQQTSEPTAEPTAEPVTAPTEEPVDTAAADKEAADKVAALIDAIYVQERTDETDAQCAAAKAAWDLSLIHI